MYISEESQSAKASALRILQGKPQRMVDSMITIRNYNTCLWISDITDPATINDLAARLEAMGFDQDAIRITGLLQMYEEELSDRRAYGLAVRNLTEAAEARMFEPIRILSCVFGIILGVAATAVFFQI